MARTSETDYALYHTSAELESSTFRPKMGYRLLEFDCRVVNIGSEKQALWHYDTHTAVMTADGESYPPIAYDMRGSAAQSEPLPMNTKQDLNVLFAVPQAAKVNELIFTLKTIEEKQGTDLHVALPGG